MLLLRQRHAMRRQGPGHLIASVLVLWLFAIAPASARVGIVLLHGLGQSPKTLGVVAGSLGSAGYRVVTPEMCWSDTQRMADDFLTCLNIVEAAVEDLKRRGVSDIFVGGHGLGGNAAAAYAARKPVAGVLMIGAVHAPETALRQADVRASLAQARAEARTMKAETPFDAAIAVDGEVMRWPVTPRVYLTYHDPEGPAALPALMLRVDPPVLWVVGSEDKMRQPESYAFGGRRHARSRQIVISADQRTLLGRVSGPVLDWFRDLGR